MKHLSNDKLIFELKNLVKEETILATRILDYLKEVETRKMFLKMGYASLFEFCVKELKYSEGAAGRRLSAMRMMKEIPEIRAKIISGDLNLTTVAQTQSFFNQHAKNQKAYTKEEKLEVLKKVENTSARECERELLKIDPEVIKKDRERQVSAELTELRITADQEFMRDIEQIKNIISHAKPHASTKEILKLAMEFFLDKKDLSRKSAASQASISTPAPELKEEKSASNSHSQSAIKHEPQSGRYVSNQIKIAVLKKSENQCCYQDPHSSRRCSAKKFLEFDHIIPLSKGGMTTIENLQNLCSAHNKLKSDSVLL